MYRNSSTALLNLRSHRLLGLALILVIMVFGLAVRAALGAPGASTIYVNAANTGIEDGTAAHPYRTIQNGVDNVPVGGTILVYPGTYLENILVAGYAGIRPQFTLRSVSGSAVTIIDGRDLGSVITIYDGVMTIEGFTIQNGGGSFGLASAGYGIVVYPYTDARATIRNNVIKNTRLRAGIGLTTSNIGSHLEALIENNYLIFNATTDPFLAGGISIDFSSPPSGWSVVRNNVVAHNHGGIRVCCYATGFQVDVVNNTIVSNTNSYGGGVTLNAASARFANNIIAMNTATSAGNDLYVVQSGLLATIEHNDIGDGQFAGSNDNISAPPLLVDPVLGNYHLTANSLCINNGTNSGAPITDFEGDPRPYGARADIGADEFVWPADGFPPTSNATSPLFAGPSFSVSWQGADQGGSGIEYYDVQVKDGLSGIWTDWLTHTLNLQGMYNGGQGHTYYFQSRAVDHAWNIETYPGGNGDTSTFVGPNLTPSTKRVAVQTADLTAGSILTYTILVHNIGFADTAAWMTDTLPNFTRYLSDSLTSSAEAAIYDSSLGQNGTILWHGTASVTVPVSITFQLELLSADPVNLPIRNSAQIDDGWGHLFERVVFVPSHDIYLAVVVKNY